MRRVGVFPGKFAPPHRGHIEAILKCGCQCDKLYVVVSHDDKSDSQLYKDTPTKPITFKQKVKWLSQELSDLAHIEVIGLDESNIDVYPHGWEPWSRLLREAIPEPFHVIFGGEAEYAEHGYNKYFPDCRYEIFSRVKVGYPITATEIRKNPYANWEYILGVAREHFVKKVLITGTESCGKTTLTKMLAKTFFTSWAQEEGRYYSAKNFGGNETVFEPKDFYNICWEQKQAEDHAIRNANKIVFFDTDAVVTQFYCKLYLGEQNPAIDLLLDPYRYNLIIFLQPDIPWVDDGMRQHRDAEKRWELHKVLYNMYQLRGFAPRLISVNGNYAERFNEALRLSQKLLTGYKCKIRC